MFLLEKQRFLAKIILHANVGCYKMSDTFSFEVWL
jgi:hypothetical protein